MIVIDSREKSYSHISEYFDNQNVPYEVRKLETGDYLNTDNPSVIVDRKASLDEILGNLTRGDRSRFNRECQRAFADKIRFIVLIESDEYETVESIKSWKSKYVRLNGRWLASEMFRLTMAYRVEWRFCKKQDTARKILELVRYE